MILTLPEAADELDAHADGARVRREGDEAHLGGHEGELQLLARNQIRVGISAQRLRTHIPHISYGYSGDTKHSRTHTHTYTHTHYLIAGGILVRGPAVQRLPPVLYEEVLHVLLALPVAESALGLCPRDEVVLHQIHLQELLHVGADLRLGAPRASVLFLANPVTRECVNRQDRQHSSRRAETIRMTIKAWNRFYIIVNDVRQS